MLHPYQTMLGKIWKQLLQKLYIFPLLCIAVSLFVELLIFNGSNLYT